jgi:kynurenine formamidase
VPAGWSWRTSPDSRPLEGESDVVLSALPLRLSGADVAPVRAVALLPAR